MAVLNVTASEDYSDGNPALPPDITEIVFSNMGLAAAQFAASQFGPGLISNTVTITGNNHTNRIGVTLSAAGIFSAAGWTIANWTSHFTDPALFVDAVFLTGSAGADTITGSSHVNAINGGDGADVLVGGAQSDSFRTTIGHADAGESIDGGGGIDEIRINGAGNAIDFGSVAISNIEIFAFGITNATATFRGSQIGHNAIARIEGNSANTQIVVVIGNLVDLSGVIFNDWGGASQSITINGTLGGDRLTGSGQNETINGAAGNDMLDGGGGIDALTGGLGDDRLVHGAGDGADIVVDFVAGAGSDDKLVLAGHAGISTVAEALAKATQNGAHTVFDFGNGDTLILQNVAKANLHADDFILDFVGAAAFAINAFGASLAAGGWSSQDKYPRTAADVNGDGRADLVGFGDAGTFVAIANANGTFQNPIVGINSFGFSPAGGGFTSNDKYPRMLGDVNGDGRADIVGFGDTGVFVALGNANGTFQNPIVGINSFGSSPAAGGFSSNNQYPRTLGDVNGDGRADIVGFGDAGVFVSLANADGTFLNPIVGINSFGFSPAGGGWSTNDKYPRTVGDVNGDGRADLVGFGDAGVFVALANANGTFQNPIFALNSFGFSAAAGGFISNNLYPRTLGDVNDDGRADIVGFGDAGLFIALGKSDGTFAAPVADFASFGPNAGGWSSNNLYPRTIADVNGDGAADVIGFGDAGGFVSLANDFVV